MSNGFLRLIAVGLLPALAIAASQPWWSSLLSSSTTLTSSSSSSSRNDGTIPPAVKLTKQNFDKMTSGKTVFIKFYAPWCGHCQKLEPIWEQLRLEWIDHKQGLVAEVDCTTDAKSEKWCSKDFKIIGFPTLLYGDASYSGSFLKEYNDEKDYETLSKFANETLSKPFCSPANPHACDDDVKEKMEQYMSMPVSDLEREIAVKEQMIDDAESQYKEGFDQLQAVYDKQSDKYENEKAAIKSNLKLLKAIKNFGNSASASKN